MQAGPNCQLPVSKEARLKVEHLSVLNGKTGLYIHLSCPFLPYTHITYKVTFSEYITAFSFNPQSIDSMLLNILLYIKRKELIRNICVNGYVGADTVNFSNTEDFII